MAQRGAVLVEKKAASCPEMLRPACHKGQLLPSHLQKRDPSQSIHRANTVRYPPTHISDGQSHCNEAASPPLQK